MRFLLSLLVVLGLTSAPLPAPASPREAETKALEARQAIHSGELRLHLNSDRSRDSDFHIFFDGPKVRFDRSRQMAGIRLPIPRNGAPQDSDQNSRLGMFTTKTVITPQKYIFFSPSRLADGSALAVKSGPINTAGSSEKHVFDIRVLGIVPLQHAILYRHNLKDVLANPDRVNSWSSEDVVSGIPCIKCSHTTERGNIATIWIAPDQGHGVLKSQLEHTNESGIHRMNRVQSVLEHYPEADLWFPSEVKFQSLRDDEVIEQEKWVVESAIFNQPLPPDTFELAGLEIPDGQTLVGVPEAQPVGFAVWDAEKDAAVPPSPEKIRQAIPPELIPSPSAPLQRKDGTWTMIVIIVNIIAIGIITLVVIWRYSKRKQES